MIATSRKVKMSDYAITTTNQIIKGHNNRHKVNAVYMQNPLICIKHIKAKGRKTKTCTTSS